eukprot:CAMPEP_0178422114 /NCGR_PEP_ID=MMETSP0689_2-20121128/27004_1 /TAXON_ID=160604 /ORGANISM="Amphidinium massartii, Strain CS-259" /LENGTH=623 /DNA_ID=CAMNT_0020043663 /DNA_START=57 /DNA_END=1924 /DNA_ORIENTATION=+
MSLDGLDGLDGLADIASAAGLPLDGVDDVLPTFSDLTPFEVEHFVGELQTFNIEDVGGPKWLTQHERIEKLNWTAHSQAKEGHDEYVVDQFNMQEKVPVLIYDLILINVWKERIWPLVKNHVVKFSSLRSYIPVYHEASVANLLEVCLFHRTSCEEAGDALIDLVDWCAKKLRYLVAVPNSELSRQVTSAKEVAEWDDLRNLDEQFDECEFQTCMCCISILRFLTDHRVAMPLAVTTRLLDTHDILMLLVPLMEKAPWVRINKINSRIEKFEEHQWEKIPPDDEGRLPKLQTQVWLAIYNIVMDGECRSRYELTSIRRENLLRLRRFINEVVVDQLPPLTNLHRTLEELSISGQFTGVGNAPVATPFVVELVAEVRETLERTYDGRWQEVADLQIKDVFVKESPEELKRLANMISIPKELFEEPEDDAAVSQAASATTATQTPAITGGEKASSTSATREDASPAYEALLKVATVRATSSFFAAAKAQEAPPDEVIVLSVADQTLPQVGGRLALELRRSRPSQLRARGSAQGRIAADAALAVKRTKEQEEGQAFVLAVAGSAAEPDVQPRLVPYVSQKGASRTAQKLVEVLSKPGCEEMLAMYREEMAQFSIPVQAEGNSEGIS